MTIGGKDFTEQNVLGEIMAILIECSSNLRVERKLYLGGTMICFNALKSGDLDLYAEYTGTGLVTPPSIRYRSPTLCGRSTPGMATEARTASRKEPS